VSHGTRAPGVEAHQHREGGAEEGGGEQHNGKDEEIEGVDGVAAARPGLEAAVRPGEPGHDGEAGHDRHANGDVEQREGPRQVADPVDEAGHGEAPEGDARQVARQNGGEPVEGPLHDDAEDLGPDDLVADGDEAGDAKEDQEGPGALGRAP
jgi:hypothetical protein